MGYLDTSGLQYFWSKLKDYFAAKSDLTEMSEKINGLYQAMGYEQLDGVYYDASKYNFAGTATTLPTIYYDSTTQEVVNLGTGASGAIVWACNYQGTELYNSSRKNVFVNTANGYDTNVLSIDLCTLQVIDTYALWCCSALTRCALPAATTLGDYALRNDTALEELTLSDTLTKISTGSLYDCTALKSLTLPATLTSIGTAGLYDCVSMTKLTCKATTPPTLGTNALKALTGLTALRVPSDSVDAYKAASGWSTYADKIVGITEEATAGDGESSEISGEV